MIFIHNTQHDYVYVSWICKIWISLLLFLFFGVWYLKSEKLLIHVTLITLRLSILCISSRIFTLLLSKYGTILLCVKHSNLHLRNTLKVFVKVVLYLMMFIVLQNTPERKRGSRPQSLVTGIPAELAGSLSVPKDGNELRERSDSSVSLQPPKKSKSLFLLKNAHGICISESVELEIEVDLLLTKMCGGIFF